MNSKKRILTVLLAALPVLVCAAAWAVPAWAAVVPVTILYTTDAHGYIRSDEKTIGLDRIAAVRQSLPGSVLLDAGDFLHGSLLATVDKGKSVVALMRETGYFAATVGNHEFSHGFSVLEERVKEASGQPSPMHILSANTLKQDGTTLVKPWAKTDVQGVGLCVFGLTTPETRNQSAPSAVVGLNFADARQTALATAAALRESGCDIVIALTHCGSDHFTPFTSIALAAEVPGLDAVIDGHSHREFANIAPGTTPVVSSGSHGKALGKLTLFFDQAPRKTVSVKNAFFHPADLARTTPDSAIAAKINALQTTIDNTLGEVVAKSPAPLPGDRHAIRTSETALGDLAADALRAAYGSDMAICNGGGIRDGFPEGAITLKNLAQSFPFGGNVISMRVTGAELLDILEHALCKLPEESGGFPQISGFSIEVDPDSPVGERVKTLRVESRDVSPTESFTLAVNEFLAQGGNDYPHLAGKEHLQSWMTVTDALVRHLKQQGVSPLKPENRILKKP